MDGVWQAVLQATSPRDIVDRKVSGVEAMQAARDEVTEEVNKNARMPPKFSADGGCSLTSPCIACVHRSACRHGLSACLLRYGFGVSLECTAVQGRGTGMMPSCMYSLFATTDIWLTEHCVQTCCKAWLKQVCFGFGVHYIMICSSIGVICSSIGVNRSLY